MSINDFKDDFKDDFKSISLEDNSFDFEERKEQMEFLSSWERSIKNNEVIFINAPTGIGKTFAYLYPILKELNNSYENDSPEPFKAIISTSTINLQEQIFLKDIPILKRIFNNFVVSILKGRNNYVCRRKAISYLRELEDLSVSSPLMEWLSKTKTGEWQEVENKIPIYFWKKIESQSGTCLGKNCPHYKNCFYFKARYKAEMSDVLIVNHHLLLRDLTKTENRFIDKASSIVIDEAHNFISSVESMASESISQLEAEYHIKTFDELLSNEKFLDFFKARIKYVSLIERARDYLSLFKGENKKFWDDFSDLFDKKNTSLNINSEDLSLILKNNILELLKKYNEVVGNISQIIINLDLELESYADKLSDTKILNFKSYSINIGVFREFLALITFVVEECFINNVNELKIVKWIDIKDKNIVLNALNLNTSYEMSQNFIQDSKSYLFTSASLSLGNNFNHMKKPLGIKKSRDLFLDSPFNLKEQISFYLSDFEYVYNDKKYYRDLNKILLNILSKGHALVLFSSYYDMNLSFKNFSKKFDKNINLYIQGRDFSRSELIEIFKKKKNSILFATRSFWEGIDIKGKKLSTLVIVKLPFKSMNDPIIYNKNKILQKYGRNPFFELMLPDMILTLKQGIGRLIRSKSDSGEVYILDKRFKYSNYSNIIMNEFKDCSFKDFSISDVLNSQKTLFD